jgi:hypothetical protein
MAALAYASGMKRLGHWYYVGVVAAVLDDDAKVVFGGSMPRPMTTNARDTLASSRRPRLSTALDGE